MNKKNNEAIEINIKELFFLLLKKLWLILMIGLLCALAAGVISKFIITPVYTSSSKLYVINRQNENVTTWADMESGAFLAKDIMILVKSRPVTEEVIYNLKLNLTDDELASMITVTIPIDTRVMNIKITYTDPQLTKAIVDEVARVSAEQLVSIMEINKITIVEKGNLPESPASPNIGMNTMLGGALGAFLTTVIIIMIQVINDTIRTADDVERYLGLTTLGMVPKENGFIMNKKSNKYHFRITVQENRRKRNAAG